MWWIRLSCFVGGCFVVFHEKNDETWKYSLCSIHCSYRCLFHYFHELDSQCTSSYAYHSFLFVSCKIRSRERNSGNVKHETISSCLYMYIVKLSLYTMQQAHTCMIVLRFLARNHRLHQFLAQNYQLQHFLNQNYHLYHFPASNFQYFEN